MRGGGIADRGTSGERGPDPDEPGGTDGFVPVEPVVCDSVPLVPTVVAPPVVPTLGVPATEVTVVPPPGASNPTG